MHTDDWLPALICAEMGEGFWLQYVCQGKRQTMLLQGVKQNSAVILVIEIQKKLVTTLGLPPGGMYAFWLCVPVCGQGEEPVSSKRCGTPVQPCSTVLGWLPDHVVGLSNMVQHEETPVPSLFS